jgi:hypothetical protein
MVLYSTDNALQSGRQTAQRPPQAELFGLTRHFRSVVRFMYLDTRLFFITIKLLDFVHRQNPLECTTILHLT